MLLRRVTEHVKSQNWIAVALDFIIVVVGVFIGIQVANWNEARVDRETGEAYLLLVADEIERQSESYSGSVEGAEYILARLATVMAVTKAPEKAAEIHEEVFEAIYRSRFRSYFEPPASVYNGLETSGNIALIQEAELLQRVRAHYARVERWNEVFAGVFDSYRNYANAVTSNLTVEELEKWLDRSSGEGLASVEFSEEEAVAIAQRLANDPAVIRALPGIHGYHQGTLAIAKPMVQQAADLANDIRRELGRVEDSQSGPTANSQVDDAIE